MADDLDRMLQGDDQDAPADSPSGNDDSGSYSASDKQPEGSEEEVEWNKLSGSASDRFRNVIREKNKFFEENRQLREMIAKGQVQQQPLTDASGQITPQVKEAVDRLDKVGIATKDFVKQQVEQILETRAYYDKLGRLEGKLDGSDGKPKFTREEYFDYIERNPQYQRYDPEDVYQKMFSEELDNWKGSHASQESPRRSQTLRPTRTASRETELTVDDIEAKLKSLPEPQRSEWYAANQKKINDAVARASQG